MGSGLRHYVTQVIYKDVKDVVVWADTCGGKNINLHEVAMCEDTIENPSNKTKA